MMIPWDVLEPETLSNLIESFVLREGTDYGLQETSLAQKVNEVMEQLQQGKVVIVWSELHGSVTILPKESLSSRAAD